MKKYIQAYHGEQRPGDAGYVRPRAMSAGLNLIVFSMNIEANHLSLTGPECWMKSYLLRDSLAPNVVNWWICVPFRQIRRI